MAKRLSIAIVAVCFFLAGGLARPGHAQIELHRVWQDDTGGTAYDVAVADEPAPPTPGPSVVQRWSWAPATPTGTLHTLPVRVEVA